MRIGSLFSGYGGLDRGVQAVLGGTVAWHSEIDPGACKILAHHYPDVPNHGDITAVDWSAVEPVDVLTGGFPCQDVSAAGKRLGIRPGTRSGLWTQFAYAIDQLRPSLVVIENVRGLLNASAHSDLEPCPWCVGDDERVPLRALGAVLGDLADRGYDASWQGLRAADAGAPHGRFRVFIVAWPASDAGRPVGESGRAIGRGIGAQGPAGQLERPAAIAAADAVSGRRDGRTPDAVGFPFGGTTAPRGGEVASGGAAAADADGLGHERGRRARDRRTGPADGGVTATDLRSAAEAWGPYDDAIRRWETVLGRPAPSPTEPGSKGQPRLSPAFVEWLMGLPAGWVTDVPGLGRNEMLKALGNGVVSQQCAAALRLLLAPVHARNGRAA